ncbi:MAG: stomatin-like protein [Mariprofundales bacterium]|nr:stomatin-like protein [Mariprofundales bacterium]
MEPLLNLIFSPGVVFAILLLVVLRKSIILVPQNHGFVVERIGKYRISLTAGLNFIVPFIDRVAYDVSLKEQVIDVPSQEVITKDNISLSVDGVLYLKVLQPHKASYGVEDYTYAVVQLAQTTMRSVIGTMDLDKTFKERDAINSTIVAAINEASSPWGVQVLRYEIKDIQPPASVLDAMERQMKAERHKRAAVLESEGQRESAINVAEGDKRAKVLAAEAEKAQQILSAEGEARAIETVAKAKALALTQIGQAAATADGQKAVQLDLATRAIAAKEKIAKKSTVVLMDSRSSDAGSVVAEAVAIVSAMNSSDAFSGQR